MLEGRLGDFTLPDILRLLAFTAKTGRLWVGDDGVQARVDVLDGQLRDASADSGRLGLARRLLGQDIVDSDTLEEALSGLEVLPTDLQLARRLVEQDALDAGHLADLVREQVIDALFDLLRWTDGGFRFEATALDDHGPSVLDLALPVDDVLEEVTARIEVHAEIEARTGGADAIATISRPGNENIEVALSPEAWTMLALVDGSRTVGELVELSGQGDYHTRQTLVSLVDQGIVTIGDPDTPPPGDRLLKAHETLSVHEGRMEALTASTSPEDAKAASAAATKPSKPAKSSEPTKAAAPAETADRGTETEDDEPAEKPVAAASEPVEQEEAPAAEQDASAGDDDGAEQDEDTPAGVTPLRAKARNGRLRTDPQVDEDLVRRLIDGVESL